MASCLPASGSATEPLGGQAASLRRRKWVSAAWAGVWGEDPWYPLPIGTLADWSLLSLQLPSRGIGGLGLAGEERQYQPRGEVEDDKVGVYILSTVGFK